MLVVRKSLDRGFADHGWLKSRHTFSFADYHDRQFMGFRSLRVINEDHIAGGTGFGTHPHRDMEIISYVVSGALTHKDSMGNTAVIRPGEVQRMSAGTGVTHSEYNYEKDRETHLLQIWILPNKTGKAPGYGQKSFEKEMNSQKLVLTVSGDARDGSIGIDQDADLYVSRLKKADSLSFGLRPGRHAWVQVVKGKLSVNGVELDAGDAVAASEEPKLDFLASEDSELLLFDLS
jgi:redox-sensitive bicupin YhaK (pirin superfamily)